MCVLISRSFNVHFNFFLGLLAVARRWVCYAFNPIDMGKTLQSASDMPTRWTHENFKYYFNV